MAEYTLLDYTQTILASLGSDQVNSISDTVESLDVVNIIKTVYNDIQARVDLPEHYTLFQLNASTDNLKPVLMTRPEDVMSIEWIQYDKIIDGATDPNYSDIKFLPINEFLARMNMLTLSDTQIDSMTHTIGVDDITFLFYNDRAPTYYTTFDDRTIIFDAYDAAVDTTLQKTKTRCYGRKDQSFVQNDTFVPFLDRDLSTLLLNEAKVLAFAELKQMSNDPARMWATRGWTKSQVSKRGIDQNRNELDRVPNYGRR